MCFCSLNKYSLVIGGWLVLLAASHEKKTRNGFLTSTALALTPWATFPFNLFWVTLSAQFPVLTLKHNSLHRAHEPAVLKSFSWFATTAARELAVPVEKSYAPEEPHKERKTLLRAAFVNKKHRVQYEMRTFYHFLTLKHLTGSTADTYLEYVQRNLPEGVSMKVVRHEVRPFPENLTAPSSS